MKIGRRQRPHTAATLSRVVMKGGRSADDVTKEHLMTAQVSLYPLRQLSIGPPIRAAVRVFERHGLHVRVGEMSTLVWGDGQAVFEALQQAFHQAAEEGDTVMCVKLSNACPEPGEEGRDPSSTRG